MRVICVQSFEGLRDFVGPIPEIGDTFHVLERLDPPITPMAVYVFEETGAQWGYKISYFAPIEEDDIETIEEKRQELCK